MPEYENDRQLVLQDFKNRLLDLSEMNLTLPATDIYDEPVRYYKANLQWAPIIEGFLDWLADIASWKDAQDDNYPAIQQLLKYLEGIEINVAIDCNEVENCITISPTVINISNEVTNINNEVTNISNEVTNNTTNITNINQEITNINETVASNEYPPKPDISNDPNQVCGSAWVIAEGLNDLIQDVISDAQSFTWSEFVESLISAFSFKFTFMKALWDFVIASANPNIASEVSASIPFVAEAIYCENLNLESAKSIITNDVRIPNDSAIAYNSAIDAMTASKLNSLIYLGSLDTSRDCSQFENCGVSSGIVTFGIDEWQSWIIDQGNASLNHGNPIPCARNNGIAPAGGSIGRCRVIIDIPRTQVANVQLDVWSIWGSNEFIFVRTYLYDGGATPVSNTEQQNPIDGAWVHQQHNHANVYADRIIVDALQSTSGTNKSYDIRLDNISWNL